MTQPIDDAPDRTRPQRRQDLRRSRRRRRARRVALSLIGIVLLLAGGVYGYTRWRFDQIPKVVIPGLTPRQGNAPFDVLFIGSDSRSFAKSAQAQAQYGSAASVGGQRSDVIIVARIVPTLHEVRLLSIPRDTWVMIPGHSIVSGPNRINAAFDTGPQLLVQTIEDSFHLPISNVVEINFPGLQNMVDAVGGVYLDFPDPVRDLNSHLGITRTGCHLVLGSQALALVRSRDLSYELDGTWYYDGLGDLSRIRRQDAFFRALLPRLSDVVSSPTRLNALLGAATSNLVLDRSLSEGELLGLARFLHGMPGADLTTETLPTSPWTTPAGADVLLPAAAADSKMLTSFVSFGTATTSTAAAVSGPPLGARLLSAVLTSTVTVTTLPSGANPGDVYTNTQAEPWNPLPCQG